MSKHQYCLVSSRPISNLPPLEVVDRGSETQLDANVYYLIQRYTIKSIFSPTRSVSRSRDPQLQVSNNYSYLYNFNQHLCQSCKFCVSSTFNFCFSARALVKQTQEPGIKLQKAEFSRNDTWTSLDEFRRGPKNPPCAFFLIHDGRHHVTPFSKNRGIP